MKNSDNNRSRRVGELIQQELARVLLRHPENPLFHRVTITMVDLAPDFSNAKVFFSLFDKNQKQEALEVLKNEAGFLRHALAKNLNLRKTPVLHFTYDESLERGMYISGLIDQAVREDEKRN